jgi:serine/threonine protein kinase
MEGFAMSIVLGLSTLALREVVNGACQALGVRECGDAVVGFLTERFTDHSQRLTQALQGATTRAWKALEVSLAGDSLWQRCRSLTARAEDQAFARQVRAFLDAAPLPEFPDPRTFRPKCLQELRAARKVGLLTAGNLDPRQLAEQVGTLGRFSDPQRLLDAEWQTVQGWGEQLARAGYPRLAWLLGQRPRGGSPLPVLAARYFFRRAVENDPKLFQGLAFAKLEALEGSLEQGFASLGTALEHEAQRLEDLLGDVQAVVVETHGAVLDLQGQIHGQSEQIREIGQAVLRLLEQRELQHRELRPADSLSFRGDGERQLVRQVVARYRALPEDDRQRLPALLNAVGKLEVVAGNFDAAQEDFRQVASLVGDPAARAEAHHNAYRAALERRDWPAALPELLAAVQLDPQRFAPFPVGKYQPQRILGAGGFGVAFLCQHRHLEDLVVVKALTDEGLRHEAGQVFSEAQLLRQLDHPAIIRITDCGFAGAADGSKPFLVMDYFESRTLEEQVQHHGPLPLPEALAVARQVAEGLQAAHGKGILHRDVKPANVLVRREAAGWRVKLIDFGLALKQPVADGAASTARRGRTLAGESIAGTLDYAPPEQLGRRPEGVGRYSDVYSFALTCCYALFGTPKALLEHWQRLPRPLAELLNRCLHEEPSRRPPGFADILPGLVSPKGAPPGDGGDIPYAEPYRPAREASQKPRPVPTPKMPVHEPRVVTRVDPVRVPGRGPAVEPAIRPAPAEAQTEESGRSRAREVVRAPALAVLALSVLGLLFNALGMFAMTFEDAIGDGSPGLAGVASAGRGQLATPSPGRRSAAERLGSAVMCLTMALASGLGIVGGWHMLQLRSCKLALAASLSVMYGGCLCLLGGVFVGGWACMVLLNPEVKAAFSG